MKNVQSTNLQRGSHMMKKTKSVGSAQKRTAKSTKAIAAAYAVKRSPGTPRITAAGRIVTISRRELVGTVSNGNATAGFTVTPTSLATPGYDVSITCGTMFPWGAQIGYAYEKYRFRKLRLSLVSGQATSASGRVYACFDPDWSDDVPSDKTRFMGLQVSVDASVWETVNLSVPYEVMNSSVDWRFCAPSTRTAEVEPRTAFAGFFAVGIDSPVANCVWDLWVDYEVELMTPTSENFGPTSVVYQEPSRYTFATGVGVGTISYYLPDWPKNNAVPLEIVTPNQANVPNLKNGLPIKSVIKLPVSGPLTGALSFDFRVKDPAITPYALLGTDALAANGDVYDSYGSFLGQLSAMTNSPLNQGPVYTGVMDTVNQIVKANFDSPIKDIKTTWPSASSIVPFLQAATPIAVDFLKSAAMMLL